MATKAALPEQLRAATLEGDGLTGSDLRQAVAARAGGTPMSGGRDVPLPRELAAYVDTVAKHAWRVTAEDIAALRNAGFSEDELFELTIAAATGAGLARLDRGLAALRGEL